MERLRVVPATWAALATLLVLGLVLAPAPAAAAPQAGRGDRLLLDDAGWHGRPVQQPHAHTTVKASTTSLPGWSAGPVALGTGATRAGGSERVRELQRRLRRLGYATGPVDGIFGPRTRAALGWFQRKHGLPADGRASARAVAHLRERTGARAARREAPEIRDRAAAPPKPANTAPPLVAPIAPAGEDEAPWGIAALALSALGIALLALGYAVERRRRRQLTASRPRPVPVAGRPAWEPPAGRPRALGYVRLARGAPSASFHAQAAAIETGCLARGMTLVSLVSDPEPVRGSVGRPPALAFALERLACGDADRLVVSRLDHLGGGAEELRQLLDVVAGPHAGIVILDRDLDTAALPDPVTVDALLAPTDSPPPPFVPRARRAIDAHIASMLDEGASREDAVAALNAEPVPPPQGGRWSSSGVDAALRRRGGADTAWRERSDA